ncbi:unnamed protein product [Lymnaea stagnalis]|uniref:G-protein coupled receptors family 1 profile domain-containing protein n=1 Tax=Lymnaea stagnalis TaxID=6523 RepID=A0AAV2IK69_LYMST
MSLLHSITTHADLNQYFMRTALWPAIIYTTVLMLVGTLGNILVLAVYRHQYQRSVTRMFIFALAAMDIGNCVITMPAELMILIRFTSFPSAFWCRFTRYLTYIFNGTSSIILITIALDRYFKVCRPTHVGITLRRARLVCVGSFLFTALLTIPALVIYGDMVFPILVTDHEVTILHKDVSLTEYENRLAASNVSHVIMNGTFCLLNSGHIDGHLPTTFYIGMLVLYIVLIVFVVFFYSQVARAMFALTRKHSKMFTFHGSRDLSTPNSAAPEMKPAKYDFTRASVAREASTFDEDGQMRNYAGLPKEFGDDNSRHFDDKSSVTSLSSRAVDRSSERVEDYGNQEERLNKNSNEIANLTSSDERIVKTNSNDIIGSPYSGNDVTSGTAIADRLAGSPRSKSEILFSPQSGSKSPLKLFSRKKSSQRIPKIKIQDTSEKPSHGGGLDLAHADSLHGFDKSLSLSSNSLLLRRIKSAENINALTRLYKLQVPEHRMNGPKFPDAYEANLPRVCHQRQRRHDVAVGQVTKSCTNLDFVGGGEGEEGAPEPKSSSEKTLTLTRKTSPQGKTNICVLPLTGLCTKMALHAQENQGADFKKCKNQHKTIDGSVVNSEPCLNRGRENTAYAASPEDDSAVTLRAKTPEQAPATIPSVCDSFKITKISESARAQRSPRQEIVSTADILQDNHNRYSLHPFRTSRMLFIISLAFAFSFLPFFIIALTRSAIGSSFMMSLSDAQLGAICIFIRSSLVSNAVNPIIYGILSTHFRRECTGLVFCVKKKK